MNVWESNTGEKRTALLEDDIMSIRLFNDPKSCMPGEKYLPGKPISCVYCFWWLGRKKGCANTDCYYRIRNRTDKKKQEMKKNCEGCPYGKHAPCIGYCMDRLLKEMREER